MTMIKQYTSTTEIKKFVHLTEQEFIMHFGQHYEASVHKANESNQAVIQIKNENGITSSIPLERANYMLEKYHRALKKKASLAPTETVVPLSTEVHDMEKKPVQTPS
ncbi:MAG: hypothetical protein RIG62_06080 [Cyclobacteriaceae bacterium]